MTGSDSLESDRKDETVVLLAPGPDAVDITPNKDGGVFKEISSEGKGDATPGGGCKVKVHYEGRLTNGDVFDSSIERKEPFEFDLGKGSVIKAWDIGIATMKEGEKARLYCREDYAYGEAGSPPKIPPKATLVFDIEMISWEAEDLTGKKDKGILRYVVEKGRGVTTPNDFATVEVDIVGRVEGSDAPPFDERSSLSFQLGEGEIDGIPPGVEKALEKFNEGEKSRLVIKPSYGFGGAGSQRFNVPGGATLEYVVTLKKFEKMKDLWMMESKEKIEHGKMFKEKGTKYFTDGKYHLALKMYKKTVDYLEYGTGFDEVEEVERKSLFLAARLNSSLCYLKLSSHLSAKNECDKVLEEESNNVKALFRRGQAFLSMNDPDKAKADFERVIGLDPNNKAASAQLITCNKKIMEFKKKEKEIYSNMFQTNKKERGGGEEWRYGWWEKGKPRAEEVNEGEEETKTKKELEEKEEEKREFIKRARERKKEKPSGDIEGIHKDENNQQGRDVKEDEAVENDVK